MPDSSRWRVPVRARRPFSAFAEISDDEFRSVVAAISERGRLLTHEDLLNRIGEAAPSLAPFVHEFVVALVSLISSAPSDPAAASEMALSLSADPALKQDATGQARFAERIQQLVTIRDLRVAAKALDVSTEYEHVFSSARVLTDVRPVFPDDDTAAPAAAVIVNNLKLDYYGPDGSLREFHVALDRADVISLRDVLDRALLKTASVRKLLDRTQLASWQEE